MSASIVFNDPTGYYQLQEYQGPNPGYRKDILDRIKERLDHSLFNHSQVMTVPMVIRFPKGLKTTPDNNCFQYFIEEYRRFFNKQGLSPHYVWVTEQNLSSNRHYHLIWFFNGNKIRYFQVPPRQAQLYWGMALKRFYNYDGYIEGLIHVQEVIQDGYSRCGYLIHHSDDDLYKQILIHYSYYAKVNTKGTTPDRVREFGASCIRSVIGG